MLPFLEGVLKLKDSLGRGNKPDINDIIGSTPYFLLSDLFSLC